MESNEIVCEACLPDAQKVSNRDLDTFLNENSSWQLLNDSEIAMFNYKKDRMNLLFIIWTGDGP